MRLENFSRGFGIHIALCFFFLLIQGVYSPGGVVDTLTAGTVLAAGKQTLSVTFVPADTTDYTSATANVTLTVNQVTPTISWSTPSAITYGTALGATQLNATASVPGTFVYTPIPGTVLGSGKQTLTVIFTPTDTTNYASATANVTLTVNQATPTISWSTPSAITYGAPLGATQLSAMASVPGTFVYTPIPGTVLGAGKQTLSVIFTPADTTDYTSATANVTLTVSQATPTISWSTPSAVTYGAPLGATQLNATASVPGTFVYTPIPGTILGAGNQTLSVIFTPNDTTDYTSATASITLTVNQATPTISWSKPSAIAYGTAIGATQLNATALVAGGFVYTPAPGTVLKVGSEQTLHVDFTPVDATDYRKASMDMTINVLEAQLISITVTPASPTLPLGSKQQLTATGTFTDGRTRDLTASVTWTSANRLAATMSAGGLATGQAAGVGQSVTISATLGSISGSTTLSVTPPMVLSITVEPNTAIVAVGSNAQFTATGTFTDSSTQNLTNSVAWSSSNNSIATINSSGMAAGIQAGGSLTIMASQGGVSGAATVTVDSPPSITTQPTGQIVAAGETAIFTVAATGTAPLSYQWKKNGTAISRATSSSYTTAAETTSDNGAQFNVTVSNSVGSVTSNALILTVNAPAGPLTVSTSTLSFGNVNVGSSSVLGVTFTNSGSANINISNVIIAGPGFTASGIPAGLVVTSGQTASLSATFAPAAAGSLTGSVSVTSDASNSPATITLSGTGVQPVVHSAGLSWIASLSTVFGYNVYRATTSGGPYTLLNSSLVPTTQYSDANVQGGQTYYYVVTAVDSSNMESLYSNQSSATIPTP